MQILHEVYREERQSYKLDLALNGVYILELFSFPNPPQRTSRPEACGLRHLAFEVDDVETVISDLNKKGIETEPIVTDYPKGYVVNGASNNVSIIDLNELNVKNIIQSYIRKSKSLKILHF